VVHKTADEEIVGDKLTLVQPGFSSLDCRGEAVQETTLKKGFELTYHRY
jgi:hypothetical protein